MKLLINYGLFTVFLSLNVSIICSESKLITAYRWTRKKALDDQPITQFKDPVLEKLYAVDKKWLNKPLEISSVFYNTTPSDYEITELQNGVSPIAYINGYLNMHDLLGINKHSYPVVTKYEEPGKTEHGKYINTKKYILVQSLEKSAYCGLIKCNIKEQHFPVEIIKDKQAPKEITLSIYKPSTTIHSWTCPAFNLTFLIGGGFAAAYVAYHKWVKK